jgi:hypothetical protein
VLLFGSSVCSRFIVNPVLLRVAHSTAAGNGARRSRRVKRARKGTVAEGLGSVATPTRFPLINNHVDWHPASPDAAPALLLEGSRGEPLMTALSVDRQRRWNTSPGRWRRLVSLTWPDFQLADLVKFNRLQTRVRNRQRLTRDGGTGLELVFGMRALTHPDQKFASVISNRATHPKRVSQVGVAALIERAGQPDPRLHREQRTLPHNLLIRVAHRKRQAASWYS